MFPDVFEQTLHCNPNLENVLGGPIRKRLDSRKATETKLKNVAHNVRRIGYIEIIDDIIPHWPRRGE